MISFDLMFGTISFFGRVVDKSDQDVEIWSSIELKVSSMIVFAILYVIFCKDMFGYNFFAPVNITYCS